MQPDTDALPPIDIRLRLSALWIATMFIYAYVDIFSLMRTEYLTALLEGQVLNTPFEVTQGFLLGAVAFIVPASVMIVLSLTMQRRRNRIVNLITATIYIVIIAGSCVGETGLYYLAGSAIEIGLLVTIIQLSRRWTAGAGTASSAT